jgi:hypothetical protein
MANFAIKDFGLKKKSKKKPAVNVKLKNVRKLLTVQNCNKDNYRTIWLWHWKTKSQTKNFTTTKPNLTQPTDCHITTIQFFFIMLIRYIKCDFSHALFSSKIKLIVRLNQIILKQKKNIVIEKNLELNLLEI